jgi:hypothetical protein
MPAAQYAQAKTTTGYAMFQGVTSAADAIAVK